MLPKRKFGARNFRPGMGGDSLTSLLFHETSDVDASAQPFHRAFSSFPGDLVDRWLRSTLTFLISKFTECSCVQERLPIHSRKPSSQLLLRTILGVASAVANARYAFVFHNRFKEGRES
jgi:hypothetical protein